MSSIKRIISSFGYKGTQIQMSHVANGHIRKWCVVVYNLNDNLFLITEVALEKHRTLEAEHREGGDEDDSPEATLRDVFVSIARGIP